MSTAGSPDERVSRNSLIDAAMAAQQRQKKMDKNELEDPAVMVAIADQHGLVPAPVGYIPGTGDYVITETPNGAWRKAVVSSCDGEEFVYKANRFAIHHPVSEVGRPWAVDDDRHAFVAIPFSVFRIQEQLEVLAQAGSAPPDKWHTTVEQIRFLIEALTKKRTDKNAAQTDKVIKVMRYIISIAEAQAA